MSIIQTIHNLDVTAFLWVNLKRPCQYRRFIRGVSHTGDGYLYLAAGLLLFFFGGEQGELFFGAGLVAYGIDVSLYLILKNTIKRDRPNCKLNFEAAWIVPSDKFSFPSGHTAAAFLFATLALHFFPVVAPVLFIWAALIGASRVLLGVHYPTDIVAGAVLGAGSSTLAIHFQAVIFIY